MNQTSVPEHLTIGLLGCGTVGRGVIRLLTEHADEIAARVGARLVVGPVAVRDRDKPRDVTIADLTDDPQVVVAGDEVDIVVEVMGGIEPAKTHIAQALRAGKAVVTANKELVAISGAELTALAHDAGARFEYEAAVAGAIPIIRPLRESLAGDRVRRVLGIVNGTTNYILTRMTEEGAALGAVLADAQRLGYAEADPTADVEGHDAASKAAILASLAFDAHVTPHQVHCEGIMGVSAIDIAHAARMGYVIKLLAVVEDTPDGVGARVHPAMVPADHPLASVRESFNAVFVEAEAAGELMFYGRGAGSLPTASAVVGDVVGVARGRLSGERPPRAAVDSAKVVRSMDDTVVQYCVRLDVADEAGVLAAVASMFGEHDVSIKSVWQDGEGDTAQLLLITHAATERNIQATLDGIRSLAAVRDVASLLRVEGGEA